MCLKVISFRSVARKDIICYKQICMYYNTSNTEKLIKFNYKEAEEFSGKIDSVQCHGKIHYEYNHIFFCTDEIKLDGANCSDKLGYKYSWIYDSTVIELNKVLDPIIGYYTPYLHMNIELGKTYTGKLEEPNNQGEINIGFHAYTIKTRRCNVKCIIPKGSEYYLGTCNEIVSNCIKYKTCLNETN